MAKLHYLMLLLLIIFLAIISGWVFESMEKLPVLTKEKLRHDPDYFLKNFTATTTNNKGQPAYQLKAKYLQHFPDDDSMEIQYPLFSFYENNIKTWTAQANEAQVTKNSKTINLKGDVILNQVSPTGKNTPVVKLTADQLTIEPENKFAHTRSKVKMYKGENFIQSLGMKADMSKNKIEFLSNTRSHYVLPTN